VLGPFVCVHIFR